MTGRLQIGASIILMFFYIGVAYLVASPSVSEEYRGYYIERNTSDWRPLKYSGSTAEGVDFSRAGQPDFIVSTIGISSRERGGRWTDARLAPFAKVVYQEPFWGEICFMLQAEAVRAQTGKEVIVRMGAEEKRFITDSGEPRWYALDFKLKTPTATIEIEPSASEIVFGRYYRKIGLGLYHLIIIPGRCADTEIHLSKK
jgi:hypothetical protein